MKNEDAHTLLRIKTSSEHLALEFRTYYQLVRNQGFFFFRLIGELALKNTLKFGFLMRTYCQVEKFRKYEFFSLFNSPKMLRSTVHISRTSLPAFYIQIIKYKCIDATTNKRNE